MASRDQAQEHETVDALHSEGLQLIQSRRGFRFSLDALLLADFTPTRKGDACLDLGTGSGILPLLLHARGICTRLVGLDISAAAIDRARRTLALNGLSDTIVLLCLDLRNIRAALPAESFSLVTANPPYRKLASGRLNPDPDRAGARHELAGTAEDFLQAGAYALKTGGRMTLIYPAARMAGLLSAMPRQGIEPKRLRLVHSFADSNAEFVLVEGRKGGREGLTVEPPLVLYEAPGRCTPEAQRILSRQDAPGDGEFPSS